MKKYTYSLNYNDSLNKCMVSKLYMQRFIAKKTPFERDDSLIGIDAKKIIYPIRKEYLANEEKLKHNFKSDEINKFYIGFENTRVEYSGFWHECNTLNFYTKCSLIVDETKKYKFKLTTCGSVKIWINKKDILEFSPYTRNEGSETIVELPLEKGENEIIISCKDLAERDINNYFQLQYLEKQEIKVELPISVDPKKIEYFEKLLKRSYLEKENYLEGDIKIIFDQKNTLEFDYSIEHVDNVDVPLESDENDKFKMKIGENIINVGKAEDLPMGFNKILLSIFVDGVVLDREYNVEVYPVKEKIKASSTLEERKKQALKFYKKHGANHLQRIFSFITDGKLEERGKKHLKTGLDYANRRLDCSDFRMPAIIWLYKKYKHIFNEKELLDIKNAILDYRFWMDEPGNDVMWFFSENHALAFHTSELLAGEIFKDEIFSNCGMTGKDHIKKALELLTNWFNRFDKFGYSEWNSAVYLPIDLISCFALYDLTENKEIKERAKKVLDKTFKIFAENNYKGVITSSHGRAYEKELRGRRTVEASALSWIAWGEGYLNHHVYATALFAISSYEPPKEFLDIAIYKSKEAKEFFSTEGTEKVDLYMYKSSNYSMASARNYKVFEFGHQQHVFQVNIGDTPESQVWINHPGENKINGVGRPSYFAGNGVIPRVTQEKNTAFIEFNVSEKHEVDFTHAYCPLEFFDEYLIKNDWMFLRKNNGYIGIYAENGFEITKTGPLKNRELKSIGRINKWTVKVGSDYEWDNFQNFINNISN